MHLIDRATLDAFIASYGYAAVFVVVGLESSGLPLPGESALLAAAVYAGTTHQLSIAGVIAAAAAGAILGDNVGYLVGRGLGVPLLKRYGPRIGLDGRKLRLTQYLFREQGGKVVFFGRFIAVLRAFAALLAGANRMPWPRFFTFNALGGVAWAGLYGTAAFVFGKSFHRIVGPIGLTLAVVVVVVVVLGWRYFKRHEAALQAEADRAFPET